jgi:hypothetical protein
LYLFAITKKRIDELWAEYLKKMDETQTIEYKSSWHNDYLKWVGSFANATGEIIFLSARMIKERYSSFEKYFLIAHCEANHLSFGRKAKN